MHICGDHLRIESNCSVNAKELPLPKLEIPEPLAVLFEQAMDQ